MMNNQRPNPYIMFDSLRPLGFTAGITIKGTWKDQDDIYHFIGRDLIPGDMRLIIPKQIHGVDLIAIDDKIDDYQFEADGVITCRRDICLSVTTADCLPVVLADSKTGYFAAVHIGWRSFVGGIVENIFQQADQLNMDLGSTQVYIGPGIDDCCFEVGPDVAILFDEQYVRNRNDKQYVALRKAVGNKFKELGIGNIKGLDECTYCRSERYYSYRRDKETPLQMVTFIFKADE
jgi:polyphenol oxidase